jgi:RNA polymerase primary sigma factor
MDRHELVRKYMPLARAQARRYQGLGLSLEDLIGQAYLGLCHAADDFDPVEHEWSFATHAGRRIRRKIAEGLSTARAFHGTREVERARPQIRRAIERLMAAGDPSPDEQAISEECGLRLDLVKEVLALIPLEAPIESFGILPELEDRGHEELLAMVEDALDLCTELGRRVLRLVKGLDGPEMSLVAVARQLGISRRQAKKEHDHACLVIGREFRRLGWDEKSWTSAIAG